MRETMTKPVRFFILIALLATATQLLLSRTQPTQIIGNDRLVSVTPLPEMGGEICAPEAVMASLQQPAQSARVASAPSPVASDSSRAAVILERPPVRTIRDSRPTYSAVAVDVKNNEIVLQDE